MLAPLNESVLPHGIRSRLVAGINGLTVHVLEAGFETPHRPLVLLIHGFPELAFSWRKLLLPLAEAGFHAVAPDQRGYGRTTGWVADFDDDVAPFRLLNLVRDALGLVSALVERWAEAAGWDGVVRGRESAQSPRELCDLLRSTAIAQSAPPRTCASPGSGTIQLVQRALDHRPVGTVEGHRVPLTTCF